MKPLYARKMVNNGKDRPKKPSVRLLYAEDWNDLVKDVLELKKKLK